MVIVQTLCITGTRRLGRVHLYIKHHSTSMATTSSILLISSIYLLIFYNGANAITGYTRRPLDGYYCNTGLYDDVGQLDQLTCTRSCIMSATCILLMYTPITNTCLHLRRVPPCPRAILHPGIMIMRFRPSLQEQCLIPSLLSDNRIVRTDSGGSRVVTRKYKDGVVCLGTSNYNGGGLFYFSGPENPTVCPEVPMEIMAVHPSCTVAWVPYTTGDFLPRGAIVMGYWNGKPSYSTRHFIGSEQSFGWYIEGNGVASYAYFGDRIDAQFEILISV